MADEITVTLPDGSAQRLAKGATGYDLAGVVGKRMARDAVVAVVGGTTVDLSKPLVDGANVSIVTGDSDIGREVIRHSTSHVLAQAVLDLWPGARFAIGPPIEDGFYYDFELPDGARFTDEDLERIEAGMRHIIDLGQPFVREERSREEALELFEGQPYKREIIEAAQSEVPGHHAAEDLATEVSRSEVISTYRNSDRFVDLCRGPHVLSTERLGFFKLMRVAGAYWRGDEHRPQLQRIYGTAWESEAALSEHLMHLEAAEKRDHRRLGAELDLFHFPPEIGSGLPVFHPKGALVRQLMEDYSRREHLSAGYQLVWTPHVAKAALFETSGHLQWYSHAMYPPMEVEGADYYLKPMNCPMHILVYKSRSRSYRELPLRLFELGTVYRFERSGVLHGLARVRGMTMDDSHIFCRADQLGAELTNLLSFVLRMLRAFGLSDFEAELSTRPDKLVGEPEEWDRATEALQVALDASGISYDVAEGEGAYYAPKVDVHLRDAIGRRWQVSTLQVDFQLPQRFDLSFVGKDNERHRPVMIHRALFGSVERFFAILLEHYAGAVPLWLSPVQARVLPVRADHDAYGQKLVDRLREAGFRADLEVATEPLGGRIRRAKLEKIPYVLVVGDDDVASETVGVNARGSDTPERDVAISELEIRMRAEAEVARG